MHKPTIRPPLTNAHKQKRLQWAHTYMKTNFQTGLFTDECRATLDGPDRWSSGWLVDGHHVPTRLRCQQGGAGVMFWAGIMGRELVRPFRVTSAKYIEFLTDHFLPWCKKKNVPSAAKSSSCMTISCCKEYLCVIGCYGHKRRETHGVATYPPLTSTLLRTFGASSSERSMRVGGS